MFRRRRPVRRPGGPLERLERAQRLFDKGKYDEAAPIFERLAAGAAQRGMPGRGADLFARAAQCHLEAGRVERAVALGKQSLRLLVRAGMMGKAKARSLQVIEALERKGYTQQATALREEIELARARGPVGGPPSGPMGRRPRPKLPGSCPHCGASVNLNEVTWAGPDRAECAYCGRVITATDQ